MIRFEFMTRDDFIKVLEWNKNTTPEFLLQWAGPLFKYPLTVEQLKTYFYRGVNEQTSDTFVYTIVETERNQCIGMIELGKIDRINKSGRVRRFLIGEQDLRGKGNGQLALQKIISIGFEKLGLHRISLGVFDFNQSAIRCYEKVGFVKEGLLRDSRKIGDCYWSLYEMSILEAEWKLGQMQDVT
jgi:RimJ/RimL family protein N-acetyltransferase